MISHTDKSQYWRFIVPLDPRTLWGEGEEGVGSHKPPGGGGGGALGEFAPRSKRHAISTKHWDAGNKGVGTIFNLLSPINHHTTASHLIDTYTTSTEENVSIDESLPQFTPS